MSKEQKGWELVDKGIGAADTRHHLLRKEVEGGWIYLIETFSSAGHFQTSATFVPKIVTAKGGKKEAASD